MTDHSPIAVAAVAAPDGVWAPARRRLTTGLVLTITLVAFEALAIATVMPVVSDDLGGLGLYGWVFSGFFLGNLLGIVLAGEAADRRGTRLPFLGRPGPVLGGLGGRRGGPVDADAGGGAGGPGRRRRRDPGRGLCQRRDGSTRRTSAPGCSPCSRRPGWSPASSGPRRPAPSSGGRRGGSCSWRSCRWWRWRRR